MSELKPCQFADGGTVSKTYISGVESGFVCPIPRTSVIFEGQKFTFAERTCRLEERHGDWYCTNCDEMVGTFDPDSELFIDGNAIEEWQYCPKCGAKVVK